MKELEPSELFDYFAFFGSGFSIVLSLALMFKLLSKKSNYSRIMRHILSSECILIYSEMLAVAGQNPKYKISEKICEIFNLLTFGFFDNGENCVSLKFSNTSVYYGIQSYSMLLNIFICLEVILILKNPISQLKSRLKPYFFISYFTGLCVFFTTFFTIDQQDFSYSLTNIFKVKISLYINLCIYLIFVIIGFISMFYLFMRFCVGKPLLQNLKNFFVVRHFIYITLYIICFLPNKINEFLVILNSENFIALELGIILNIMMGSIMFLIRVSETSFYSMICCQARAQEDSSMNQSYNNITETLKEEVATQEAFFDKDQPLTAIITRNMNMEFMCCILYGLSEIFLKPERKAKSAQEDFTMSKTDMSATLNLSPQISQEKSLLGSYKSISEKDFHKAKSHKIRYKKIFNSEVDLAKLEVEILPSKKKKAASLNKEATIDSSLFDSESQAMDNISEKEKNTQHDATVIEYCPRIFRDLRRIDDISGYDLEKYFYLI
jgi:hypothetical protein